MGSMVYIKYVLDKRSRPT